MAKNKNMFKEMLEYRSDYNSSISYFLTRRGTMLKYLLGGTIAIIIAITAHEEKPIKDWTDDIKLDIAFPIIEPKISYIDPTQVTCLAKNMYFEARSEGVAGVVATTQVVYNRVASEQYPNTICDVIEQAKISQWWLKEKGIKKPIKNKCQFSWFCDGYSDEPKDEKTYNELYTLAEEFVAGQHKNMIDITDGALWYHADYVHPRWANHKEVTTKVGRHIFYR